MVVNKFVILRAEAVSIMARMCARYYAHAPTACRNRSNFSLVSLVVKPRFSSEMKAGALSVIIHYLVLMSTTVKIIAMSTNRRACSQKLNPRFLESDVAALPAQQLGTIRLVVLSDTHGRHKYLSPLPDGDVLMHLGDAADRGSLADIRSFAEFMKQQPHKTKLLLDGNHDQDRENPGRINLQEEYKEAGQLLQDAIVQIGSFTIMGVSWKSCEENSFLVADEVASYHDGKIDIILTHSNPFVGPGHGWEGSKEMTNLIAKHAIPLHLFGHVHWGRGIRSDVGRHKGIMVNAASAFNKPVVIDWNIELNQVEMVFCPTPQWKEMRAVQQLLWK